MFQQWIRGYSFQIYLRGTQKVGDQRRGRKASLCKSWLCVKACCVHKFQCARVKASVCNYKHLCKNCCAYKKMCVKVSVRKPLRTFFCTHNSFYIDVCNYTQMLLHVHTETCARSTLLHTTNFYIERLCVPFFDHLPFVFLSSIFENCSHESIAETF